MYKRQEISDIFKVIIHNGKGIEINTSAVGLSYNDTNPNLEIIKLYRQMGGEIITVGSDSHGKENIGKGFSLVEEYLRRAGFRFLTVFRKQRPVFVDIS